MIFFVVPLHAVAVAYPHFGLARLRAGSERPRFALTVEFLNIISEIT